MRAPHCSAFGPAFPALLLTLLAPVGADAYNANDIISAVAGTGTVGYSGDAGPAVSAQLNAPRAVAFDATGNWMYICDVGSHVVRRVSMTSGLISTVAGTGTAGYNGDNIPATSAQLSSPYALAVDGAGDLYIADSGNNRIRKVATAAGTITTLAGTGAAGCSNASGDPATATISNPGGLTFDSAGNLLIADTGNGVIRKIGTGGTISTFAGTCGGTSYTPNGMTADNAGNVYFADANHNRVYTISAGGTVALFAGSGTAGYAGDGSGATAGNVYLNHPYTVAHDVAGDVYIGDSSNHVVRVVTPDDVIHTAAGNGTAGNGGDGSIATTAELNFTFGVGASPAGVLVVVDGSSNPVVRAVGPAAPVVVVVVGAGISVANDRLTSADGRISCPGTCGANYVSGLPLILTATPDSPDTLFQWTGASCSGQANCTLRPQTLLPTSVTAHFTAWYIKTLLGGSVGPPLQGPFALTFDAAGNLYFSETTDCVVRRRTPSGTLSTIAGNGVCGNIGDGIPATEAELGGPHGIAIDGEGNLYIQDTGNGLIRKVGSDGILHDFATLYSGANSPALAIDPQGNLLVPGSTSTILRVTPGGVSQTFATINYVAPDALALGSQGEVVVYGAYNLNDAAYTFLSNQGVQHGFVYYFSYLPRPAGLVIDRRGVEYGGLGCGIVASRSDPVTHTFSQSEIVPDACGYAGDGGPAAAASLADTPPGLAFDGAGFLYVADFNNGAIRMLYPDAMFTGNMEQ